MSQISPGIGVKKNLRIFGWYIFISHNDSDSLYPR